MGHVLRDLGLTTPAPKKVQIHFQAPLAPSGIY